MKVITVRKQIPIARLILLAAGLACAATAVGKPASGRYVRIELPGEARVLSLAEVEIFENGVNVAVKGKASSSSVIAAGVAGRAIDGSTEKHQLRSRKSEGRNLGRPRRCRQTEGKAFLKRTVIS